MTQNKIEKITVIGAGTMGSGIAQVAASAGYTVYLHDVKEEYLEKSLKKIRWSLEKLYSKGYLKEDVETIYSRINPVLDLSDAVSNTDFIIEAIPEDLYLKKKIFSKLDELCDDHVIFASNTSTISISLLASATKRPDRFVGLHFFNPPQIMKLVEIVKSEYTDVKVVDVAKSIINRMGKEPVILNKDHPGFIANRILIAALNEAYKLLENNVASKEDIDKAVKLGLGWPMGPFELSDFIGLDVILSMFNNLNHLSSYKNKPPKILENLVMTGYLGKKASKGFYEYKKVKK